MASRALILLCLILSGCAAPASDEPTTTTPPTTITGTITIQRPTRNVTPCTGHADLESFHGGANLVVVRDGESNIVAVGELEDGEPVPQGEGRYFCQFAYQASLAGPADFYTFEVDGRDGPAYSHAQLEEDDWQVDFTIE